MADWTQGGWLQSRGAKAPSESKPTNEFALRLDIYAVLWVGLAQELADHSNFWEAVEETNRELAAQELYASHFFEETQVILRPTLRQARVQIPENWKRLQLWRLSDLDLLLSKLMCDDPQDFRDALFIVTTARLDGRTVSEAIAQARVPEIAEIKEQFKRCREKLLRQFPK